jgi:RNA polymerase sigma-70 factor (ECF subfamily)
MKFPQLGDPDDLIQESYFRILKARAAGRLEMSKAYFFTVARNLGYDHCRRRQTVRIDAVGDLRDLSVMAPEASAADSAADDNDLSILSAAISALPERCREVVTLRRLSGLTHRQIGARLGISEKTSMAHMNQAMSKLREYLTQHGTERDRNP